MGVQPVLLDTFILVNINSIKVALGIGRYGTGLLTAG
jgi:hypothetical protein